jgi:GNAT superfamily N-acetyltransferase
MKVKSLGLWTDIELARTRGQVFDHGTHLAIVTPDDPTYHFGNLLILPEAPRPGELPLWLERFRTDVGEPPRIKHTTLEWDGTTGEVPARAELEAAGFTVEVCQVMRADRFQPSPLPDGLVMRALAPAELPLTIDLAFEVATSHEEGHRTFLQRRVAWQAELVRRRLASFWAAFDGNTLVGSLGIANLWRFARYQDVQVAASHRRRGIASALLGAAAQDMAATGTSSLIIVAEQNSAAAAVYERAGFRVAELIGSASRSRS